MDNKSQPSEKELQETEKTISDGKSDEPISKLSFSQMLDEVSNVLWKFSEPIRRLFLYTFSVGFFLAAAGDTLLIIPNPFYDQLGGWVYVGKFFVYVIKDIGVGLIVASVSVFGYEHIRKFRHELEEKDDLKKQFEALDAAKNVLHKAAQQIETSSELQLTVQNVSTELKDHLNQVSEFHKQIQEFTDESSKLISGYAEFKFAQALENMFSNSESEKKFSTSIQNLVSEAIELKKSGTLDSQEYLKFIALLTDEIVLANAEGLSKLENSRKTATKIGEWNYSVLEPRDVAARMLGHQIDVLTDGVNKSGSYCSVSDLQYWEEGHFDYFFEKIETACRSGIQVKRIFNVIDWIEGSSSSLKNDEVFQEAKRIIDKHLKLQETAKGKYQLRFFGNKQVREALKDTDRGLKDYSLKGTRFGIFIHNDEEGNPTDDVVWFRARDSKLVTMSLSRYKPRKYIDRFNIMWAVAENAPNPFVGDNFQPDGLK